VLKFAVRVMTVSAVLCVALVGSSVAVAQALKSPELAYISYDGRATVITIFDLSTRVTGVLPGTEGVSYFAWSPDGQQIAFVVQHTTENSPLYVLSAAGHNRHQVAQVEYINKSPWSPDGQKLVYTRNDASRYHVYVMSVDESQSQALLDDANVRANPLWSPDGQYIAFLETGGAYLALDVNSVDGKLRRKLTGLGNVDFAWSPQGHALAFVKPGGLWIADVVKGTQTRLVDIPSPIYGLSWSPDGKTLAFVSVGDRQQRILSIMDTDGGQQKRLVENMTVSSVGSPAWSADGNQIAFAAIHSHEANSEIYVTTLDAQVRQVTFNDTVDWLPSWRP
jgi:TolB protein